MRNSVMRGVTALTGTLVLGLAASAFAADGTVQFEQGLQPLTFSGSVGGGEFGAYGLTNPSILAPIAPPVKVNDTINGINGFQFQTFCVEPGTHIAFHTPLDYTVATTVQLPGGATRPLNAATAYLFTKFWNNTAFTSPYAYTPLGTTRSASAANMQLAIWYTEGVSSYKSGVVSDYIDEAIAATSAGGSWATIWGTTFPGSLGNVRVLNLAQGTDLQQDVLVLLTGGTPTQQENPPPDCCGYKDLTFKYSGTTSCVSIYAVDPTQSCKYFDTSLSCYKTCNPGTTFTVSAGSCWKPGRFPDSIKLVVKDKYCRTIECVTVNTSCTPGLTVGTVYGSFTLTGFHEADCPPPATTKCWDADDWKSWFDCKSWSSFDWSKWCK